MNGVHRICKKVVVGAFLVVSVDSGFVQAMAVAIPKPEMTSAVQSQAVPLAIPATAPVEDAYTFSPQHDSALNYWVDAQQDNFDDCRVVVDGVKKTFGLIQKRNNAGVQNGCALALDAGVVPHAAVPSTKAESVGQKNSAPDTKPDAPCKKQTAAALDTDAAKCDKNPLVLTCANCGSQCITLEPYKKDVVIADKKTDDPAKTVPATESKPTVVAAPSTLRTVMLTTGQVGIGAVAGYLLFRTGLSVVKSLEKKRHTRTITFDEE